MSKLHVNKLYEEDFISNYATKQTMAFMNYATK